MKSLELHISSDMKPLKTSLKESLLDDLEDLEKESDKNVDKVNSIGSEYKVSYVENYGLIDKFEKRKMKNYQTPWNQNDVNSFKHNRLMKANKTETMLCNIILGMPLSSMKENTYGGDHGESGLENEIFSFFQDILRKDYESTHKFRSNEFITLECYRSRIVGI